MVKCDQQLSNMGDRDRYRALLDHAREKIAVVDGDGRFQYLNAATHTLLGYDPGSLVGEDSLAFVHPEDRPRVVEAFERVIGGDGPEEVAYRFRANDDTWVHLESLLTEPADPSVEGYVVSSRDVTDRVAAERRRERSEARLSELAAKSTDVLWTFTADWEELLFINEAYEEIYGGTIEELREAPQTFLDRIHPDDRDPVATTMKRLSEGTPAEMEYRVNPDEGFRRWVWVQAQPVVEDGEVERVVGFSRDVTDRRRRERHLRVLDTMLRHTLRNEMNVLLGHASSVEATSQSSQSSLDTIEAVGERLLSTVDKQRAVIRLLNDPTYPEPVDVCEATRRAVEAVEADHPEADLDVSLPGSYWAFAIPRLRTAVKELLDNAVRHADSPDPSVRVSAESDPAHVRLTVTDDGPPIPENEYSVLTGEQEMTDVFHGTGVGLWLVYWIVDLSGGTVEFTTDESGNRVVLRLRRASPDVGE